MDKAPWYSAGGFLVNPNSSGIFSTRSEVAWCAKKPTAECALKNNAKTDVKFSKAKFG